MTRAVVLGGGVAGIAAAFALRDRGLDVELLESRPRLGGRAFTLPARDGAISADNGPHVMLGCYDAMRALLRRIGTEDAFEQPPALRLGYAEASGSASVMQLARLPVPVALPLGLLSMRAMPLGGRLRALRGLAAAMLGARADESLAAWLARRGQLGAPRSWLWDPMCRAIMNAEAEDVSAALFLRTVRTAFTGSAARGAIWAPKRPWSEIIGGPARARLESEGVTVTCGARVTGFGSGVDRVRAVEVAGAAPRELDGDAVVVSALPWFAFAKLVGSDVPLDGSPIVSAYFELESGDGLPDEAIVALVDGEPFHFYARNPGAPLHRCALLSGGSRAFDGLPALEIAELARAQLARHFPRCAARSGEVRVTKENRATFVAAPGREGVRPAPGRVSPFDNLLVCGDWTATGFPSTLEGAARSAALAAADSGFRLSSAASPA